MQKDSEHSIEVSSGMAAAVPESVPGPNLHKPGLLRDLGARADRMVVIDYGDDRVIHYDRGIAADDIHLAHSAHARHLGEY